MAAEPSSRVVSALHKHRAEQHQAVAVAEPNSAMYEAVVVVCLWCEWAAVLAAVAKRSRSRTVFYKGLCVLERVAGKTKQKIALVFASSEVRDMEESKLKVCHALDARRKQKRPPRRRGAPLSHAE